MPIFRGFAVYKRIDGILRNEQDAHITLQVPPLQLTEIEAESTANTAYFHRKSTKEFKTD